MLCLDQPFWISKNLKRVKPRHSAVCQFHLCPDLSETQDPQSQHSSHCLCTTHLRDIRLRKAHSEVPVQSLVLMSSSAQWIVSCHAMVYALKQCMSVCFFGLNVLDCLALESSSSSEASVVGPINSWQIVTCPKRRRSLDSPVESPSLYRAWPK